MKYRLLKDLPGLEKGSILSEYGSGSVLRILVAEEGKTVANFFSNEMFEKFFEEIKEPVDSIHWEPKPGEAFWYIDADGDIYYDIYNEARSYHYKRFEYGNIYRTLGEAKDARNRRLAEVRLRRTSTFEPDFDNDRGGYVVFYNPQEEKLETHNVYCYDYGEIVRYETVEEAEKSIKENERDWKIYFGVEEEE